MSNLELIYKACCEVSGLDLSKKTREQEYIDARMIYFHYSRNETNETLSNIGALVSRNHATVLNGARKYNDSMRYKHVRVMSKRVSEVISGLLLVDNDEDKESLNMAYLISQNNKLEEQISILRKRHEGLQSGFLYEIDELPEGLKQEFKELKWLPFKKMQESRKHYAFTINQKPVL